MELCFFLFSAVLGKMAENGRKRKAFKGNIIKTAEGRKMQKNEGKNGITKVSAFLSDVPPTPPPSNTTKSE